MPQTNLSAGYAQRHTVKQVDAALTRARQALYAGCEQGDLDGVRLALGVLDTLLDTRLTLT